MHSNIEMLAQLCVGTGLVTVPIQIVRLYRKKSADQIPLINWLVGAICNFIQMLYFCDLQKQKFVHLYLVNFSLCLIVIWQIIYYQRFANRSSGEGTPAGKTLV